jgi:hypothetical protein
MQKSKTYFEQVPLEVVSKIIEEQSVQEELVEQVVVPKRGSRVAIKPKDAAA